MIWGWASPLVVHLADVAIAAGAAVTAVLPASMITFLPSPLPTVSTFNADRSCCSRLDFARLQKTVLSIKLEVTNATDCRGLAILRRTDHLIVDLLLWFATRTCLLCRRDTCRRAGNNRGCACNRTWARIWSCRACADTSSTFRCVC